MGLGLALQIGEVELAALGLRAGVQLSRAHGERHEHAGGAFRLLVARVGHGVQKRRVVVRALAERAQFGNERRYARRAGIRDVRAR